MNARAEVPPLSLATAYFGSALCFLLCGVAGLVWIAPDLAAGAFPLRRAVAVTHLFTLGWITLSMLGALHHFVAVSLHVTLMPLRCAFVQLVLFAFGLLGFVAGELAGVRWLALGGAVLVALALLLFAVRLLLAMLRTARVGRTARAMIAAAVFLVITAAFGVLLAGEPAFGWLGERRPSLVALHVHVALVGWVLLVVVAVAQRLLPMFLMTRAPGARASGVALVLIAGGAIALLALHGSPPLLRIWLPLALTGSGLAVFLWQSGEVYSHRGMSELDPGMRFAGVALVFFAVALLLAPFAFRFGYADPQRLVLYVSSSILAAAALFVCGHYYRIVPFLVWSHRFATTPEGATTSPQSLYRGDVAICSLLCFVTGATTLLVSFGHGAARGAQAGALAFGAGAVLLALQITGVLRRAPAAAAAAALSSPASLTR